MRIHSLTLYRFIASFFVVFFHYGRETALAQSVFFVGTVMFFFVLSGYVFTLRYFDRKIVYKDFLKARLYRIAPAYFVALFLTVLLKASPFSKRVFIFSLFFVQAWFPPLSSWLNGLTWYISVIMSFYLIFPFILQSLKEKLPRAKNFLLVIFLFWVFSMSVSTNLYNTNFYRPYPSIQHDLIFYFPPVHLASFLLGIAGAYYYLSIKGRKISLLFIRAGVFSSLLLSFLVLNNRQWFGDVLGFSLPTSAGLYAPIFMALLLFSSLLERMRSIAWLDNPVFNFLGNISYVVYVFQLPIHYAYTEYLQPVLSVERENVFYVYFLCLLVFSALFNNFVEKPLIQLLKRKF